MPHAFTYLTIISKIDSASVAYRDGTFRVGDCIAMVNGESVEGVEIAQLIKDMTQVSLTATRKRNSVKVSLVRHGLANSATRPIRISRRLSCVVRPSGFILARPQKNRQRAPAPLLAASCPHRRHVYPTPYLFWRGRRNLLTTLENK